MSTVGGPRLSTIPKFTNTYSMDFDGVDDVLSLGENSTVGTGGTNTLSFWVKGGAQSVVTISDYLFSSYGAYNWWKYFHGHDTNLYWRNINGVAFNVAPNVFDGDWHNIVIIRNPSDLVDGSLRIYVDNGTPLDRTLDYRYGVAGLYNGPLGTIGNNITASSGFNGKIDEVSVWDSEITPSDVSTIYNGGAPNDLTDLSPDYWLRNGDNGSWKSPQWLLPSNENKDKVSNYSFEFDGIDDVIPIRTMASMVGVLDEVSYSCWIRTSTPGVYQDYQCPFGGYSNAGATWNIGRLGTPYNTTNLVIYTSGLIGTTILNDGNWHHIVSTFNKTTKEGIWYVDGNIEGTKTLPSYLTHFAISIGAGNGTNDYYFFNGNVDECSVWSNVLTQSEVTYLYNNGTPTDLTNLSPYGWYRMGEEANFTSNWLVDNSALDNYSKRSFDFDGLGDYIDVGTSLNLGTDSTVSFWVKRGRVGVDEIFLGEDTYAFDYLIFVTSSNTIYVRIGTVFLQFIGTSVTSVMNDTTNWINIVVVRSGDSIELFLNGNSVGTKSGYGALIDTRFDTISAQPSGGYPFMGNIDEVAAWDTNTINPIDIYNGGTPTDLSLLPTPPVNNYRMGEDASFNGANWTIPDQVGTNNGTSANMTVDDLVGESPNYTGGGISEGMDIEDRVGNAPNSDNNTLSINMEREDRVEDTP